MNVEGNEEEEEEEEDEEDEEDEDDEDEDDSYSDLCSSFSASLRNLFRFSFNESDLGGRFMYTIEGVLIGRCFVKSRNFLL